jgi:hypothetical protein
VDLTNSKRIILSASYVTTQLTPDEQHQVANQPSHALEKLNYIRHLAITPQEMSTIEKQRAEAQRAHAVDVWPVVEVARDLAQDGRNFSPDSALASKAAALPSESLIAIGDTLARIRQTPLPKVVGAVLGKKLSAAPVGRLHLERIEMYPVGTEQGELVFTVPLAPEETVTISHKEWSTSSQEYESIVDDYFESYSERGVAEKTDASISTENETKHSNAFDFTATASGGYGGVTLSTSVGLKTTSDDSQSVKQSAQHSREVTEKASARTRQEHKVSIKLETKKGVDDSSFRTITNPYNDRVLRIDYFRMMRKWRTDLYRYGLRLTFDVAVPNPGARLWALFRCVNALDAQIKMPFEFALLPSAITDDTWPNVAAAYSATIDAPPQKTISLSISRTLNNPDGGLEMFEFLAPDGYSLEDGATASGMWYGPGDAPAVILPPNSIVKAEPPIIIASGSGGTFTIKSSLTGGAKHKSFFLILDK